MIKALGKSLLLLLAIAGQTLAAPGMSDIFAGLSLQTAQGETALCSEESPHHSDHGDGSSGSGDSCEQTCKCCPGHCTNALPAGAIKLAIAAPLVAADIYSDPNSSPAPETAIRPPISR